MASSISKLTLLAGIIPVASIGSAGYAAYRIDWANAVQNFVTGPGRTSRILLLLFVIFNWKNMPFAWTYRVWSGMLYHMFLRKSPVLTPKALFKPMITPSHTPLLEIDYNLHKSNSTYFADLDVARAHLVTFLARAATEDLARNVETKIVLDPKTGKPIKGPIGVMLGAVACSFKREIAPYKGYEMWSRILSWDRKWLYIVTHYVPKGTAKPTEWLDPRCGLSKRGPKDATGDWQKKIYATAISKYVFKIDRFTVHPAHVLGGRSNLLPERPGGWMSGEEQVGDLSIDVSDVDLSVEGEWDWRRVEAQRRQGMKMASNFQGLEELHDVFDGGNNGAIGMFGS
ncbi:hypothetical protein B0T10DRAFT_485270 [Thelonectria olida]|uniref:Capsule polysaccharide biosynthesis protein n=1 Tax=Thelonectria olida TaxID=1576542 RepID=A0A9P9ARP4_9HYPO|nr:hypothetical protein B0T10DRAFT_485270 [Thelonectria olida]